jgi:hypothetical protein
MDRSCRRTGSATSSMPYAPSAMCSARELLNSAQQCTCVCGLILLAGRDADGTFAVLRGTSGAYDPEADQEAIDGDLESKRDGPCPAAQALADFHASTGYRAFTEAFND